MLFFLYFCNKIILGNVNRKVYGNLMLLYAIEDVKEGAELTTSYLDFDGEFYAQRTENLKTKWNFECNCRLCELDRADPKGEIKRKKLLDEFKRELKTRYLS